MTEHSERLALAVRGRYAIEREIGSGGMATVYLARDLRHPRLVALKVIKPELAETLGAERFLREIDTLATLHHPHILPLYDSGEAGGFPFYVMPYEEGHSLRERLAREGPLPVDDAVRILRDVVDALAHAHQHGIVHRDIKPDNVLLSGRHALVSDFGVSKAVMDATGQLKLTSAGVALGTPAYMAPEQAAADPHIDHRADIYALGVLAYEMLAGRPPFTGHTPQQVLAAHLTQVPESVAAHRPALPRVLAELVMKCLEKRPADRWQRADEILACLENFVTPSLGTAPVAVRRIRRRTMGVAAGAIILVGLGFSLWRWLSNRVVSVSDATGAGSHVVAVLPFRTVGASLALWREGMVDLLAANLDGAGGIRVVPPARAIARSGDSRASDPAQGATVARQLGAATFVTGSVVTTGAGRVRLVVDSYAAADSRKRPEASFALDGGEEELGSLADSASLLVLTGLSGGQVPALRGARLTASLPALRAYLTGLQSARTGAEEEAWYFNALAADSTFALPLFRLFQRRVTAFGGAAPPPTQAELIQRLLPHIDRLPEREQRLLVALRRGFVYVDSTERDALLDYVRRYPDDARGWTWLGLWYFRAGEIYDEPVQRVVDAGKQATALDSATSWLAYYPAISAAARLGDSATAADLFTRARFLLRQSSQGWDSLSFDLALRLRFGAPDTVRQLLVSLARDTLDLGVVQISVERFEPSVDRALSLAENVIRAHLSTMRSTPARALLMRARRADIEAARGRYDAASATLDTVLRRDPQQPDASAAGALALLSGLARPVGGFGVALNALKKEADGVLRGVPDSRSIRRLTLLSLVDILIGDTAAAVARQRALHAMPVASLADSALVRLDSLAVYGRLALLHGDTARAVRMLEAVSRVAPNMSADYERVDAVDQYLLARLYVARGERAKARALLDRPERIHAPAGGTLGLKLLLSAQLAEEAGDTVAARMRYRDVVELWRDGDAVVQRHLQQARAALAGLGSE